MWYTDTGEVVSPPFTGHPEYVTSVAFSPDGKHIVYGSNGGSIRVWETDTGKKVFSLFNAHTGPVVSVAISPDGKRIVSGSYDKTIRVWDTDTGEVVSPPFKGHASWITSVAFSPDGKRVVSVSFGHIIRMWNTEAGERAYEAKNEATHIFSSPFAHILPSSDSSPFPGASVADSARFPPAHQLWESNTLSYLPEEDFTVTPPGWVVGKRGELLFWVPPDCRAGLWWPRTVAIMGVSKNVDLDRFVHGTSWADCRTEASN